MGILRRAHGLNDSLVIEVGEFLEARQKFFTAGGVLRDDAAEFGVSQEPKDVREERTVIGRGEDDDLEV